MPRARPYDPVRYSRWYALNRAKKIAQAIRWREESDRYPEWWAEYIASGMNAAKCRRYRLKHLEQARIAYKRWWAKNGPAVNAKRRKHV